MCKNTFPFVTEGSCLYLSGRMKRESKFLSRDIFTRGSLFMKKRFILVLIATFFLANTFCLVSAEAYPPDDMSRIIDIPDLLQTHWKGKLDLGGYFHCGPVAASNAMAWLYLAGYKDLLPGIASLEEEQIQMVRILGSSGFMNTDFTSGGTTTRDMVDGILKYLHRSGYDRSAVYYAGWDMDLDGRNSPVPDMKFLKRGFEKGGAVLLNIGWYSPETETSSYSRKSGHWVTMAGYGKGEKGIPAEDIIVVHDPAPWAGKEKKHHYVRFVPLPQAYLTGPYRGLPVDACGYLVAEEGLCKPSDRVVGIVEGAIVIRMEIQFPFSDPSDNLTRLDI